jgi:hypothetical protein
MTRILVAMLLALPAAPALAQVLYPAQYQAPKTPVLPAPSTSTSNLSPTAPISGPTVPPGLYVTVTEGLIVVSNPSGLSAFQAGQFGYVPNMKQPPVLVPQNPGMQFTPPPAFSVPVAQTSKPSGTSSNAKTVDCEVR